MYYKPIYFRIQVLLLLCLVPLCIAIAFEAGAAKKEPAYFLDQLALDLKDAPGPVRADLAFAAISELAAAYGLESRLARQEIQRQAGQRKLKRWALAVERLAFELEELAQSVTAQSTVHIRIGPGNNLYLIVDDKPVVISGPRADDQTDLEKRIVSRFCSLQPCQQLLPMLESLDAEPKPKPLCHLSVFSANKVNKPRGQSR
jgi:hypothetical protein